MIEFETEKGLKEGKDRERNKPGGRERRNNERKKGIVWKTVFSPFQNSKKKSDKGS